MHVIELSDYYLAPVGTGHGISCFSFALSPGDVCAIDSQSPDDAHAFLRALATLVRPLSGKYTFKGRLHNLNRYDEMLCCKQKIGYLAPDTALISNMTLRQNLLLTRYYYENTLNIHLDETVLALCRTLAIEDKLDKRPAGLNSMEIQAAIALREISKKPEVLLLNQPENFIGHAKYEVLIGIFGQLIAEGMPVVFLSYDRRLVRRFANRKILINQGSLTTVAVKQE
jgi:ABC-type lipoprotein export system ATPase subunit